MILEYILSQQMFLKALVSLQAGAMWEGYEYRMNQAQQVYTYHNQTRTLAQLIPLVLQVEKGQ